MASNATSLALSTPSTTMPAASAITTTTTKTSTVVCFKCAGTGRVQVKRKLKRPRPPSTASDYSVEPEPELALAANEALIKQGSRNLQVIQSCHVCQGNGVLVSSKKERGLATAGIITTARRPPGFRVWGPLPPSGTAIPNPVAGEALCCLTGAWRIFQPLGGHRYSTDDVVTAWVAGQEAQRGWGAWLSKWREGQEGIEKTTQDAFLLTTDRTTGEEEEMEAGENMLGLDLGCGLGSVLMMVCWQLPRLRSVGVEAQAASVERARRSLLVNGCSDRVQVQHADFRTLFSSSCPSLPSSCPSLPTFFSPSSPSFTDPPRTIPPPPSVRPSQPLIIEAHSIDLITGTPPYFDGHGAPPPSYASDPPINVSSLPSSSPPPSSFSSSSTTNFPSVIRTKSGKPRLRPSILPTAEDQRPCNFELRGGVEVYIHTASLALAPRGIFVMCASDLPGVEARVLASVEENGLVVLRKMEVLPKEGQPSLFAVYTMCQAGMAAAFSGEKGETENEKGGIEEVPSYDGSGTGGEKRDQEKIHRLTNSSRKPTASSNIRVRETLAVREAMPTSSEMKTGIMVHRRTTAYRQVLHDMCMPDNEV